MSFRIIADSSSNLYAMDGVDYAFVPLKVITAEKEYPDVPALDLDGMIEDLKTTEERTGSSCPNVQDWLDAFEGAEGIFAVAITSNLSGSYGTAANAAEEFMQANPGKKAAVLDTLSTGPEMELIAERLRNLINDGLSFEEIETSIREYMTGTHLLFCLRSLHNLARNGRVSPIVAKLAGVLGIRLVGRASDVGTLEPLHKCRGEKKALETLYEEMTAAGFAGGAVRISHCRNETFALALKDRILADYPACDVNIRPCGALCSYYAEEGGLLVGFEDGNA